MLFNQRFTLQVFLVIFWKGKVKRKILERFDFDSYDLESACEIAKGLKADFEGETGINKSLLVWKLSIESIPC